MLEKLTLCKRISNFTEARVEENLEYERNIARLEEREA